MRSESGVSSKRRPGSFLLIAGSLCIVAALVLVGYNLWDSWRAGQQAEVLQQELEDASSNVEDTDTLEGMASVTIDGRSYIGTIEVPSLGISLPVALDWDYDQLRLSPCRYSGSYLDDDLVICGHNYRSHFGPLLRVDIGAEVDLATVDGQLIRYVVGNVETLAPTSIEEMVSNDQNEDQVSEWDLTLFTCTLGGRTRCAVRCLRQTD